MNRENTKCQIMPGFLSGKVMDYGTIFLKNKCEMPVQKGNYYKDKLIFGIKKGKNTKELSGKKCQSCKKSMRKKKESEKKCESKVCIDFSWEMKHDI